MDLTPIFKYISPIPKEKSRAALGICIPRKGKEDSLQTTTYLPQFCCPNPHPQLSHRGYQQDWVRHEDLPLFGTLHCGRFQDLLGGKTLGNRTGQKNLMLYSDTPSLMKKQIFAPIFGW